MDIANDSRNYAPTNEHVKCPMPRFCTTSNTPSTQNQHDFGCPTHVLKKELQNKKKIRKWSGRIFIKACTECFINSKSTNRSSITCVYDDLLETMTGS
jgi:hypothetical protein